MLCKTLGQHEPVLRFERQRKSERASQGYDQNILTSAMLRTKRHQTDEVTVSAESAFRHPVKFNRGSCLQLQLWPIYFFVWVSRKLWMTCCSSDNSIDNSIVKNNVNDSYKKCLTGRETRLLQGGGGAHCTEVESLLLTQEPCVQILAFPVFFRGKDY